MISYALRCDGGHSFDSWFQNSAAFDKQVKRGLVTCPICDSAKVEKAIMAPRLGRKSNANANSAPEPVTASVAEAPAPVAAPAPPMALMSKGEIELRARIKELHDHVLKVADNVGKRFPDEARKIHYGEEKARPIVGEASLQEAKALIEEGIDVAPLPSLPDDRN